MRPRSGADPCLVGAHANGAVGSAQWNSGSPGSLLTWYHGQGHVDLSVRLRRARVGE